MSKAYTLTKPRKSEKTSEIMSIILKAADRGEILTLAEIGNLLSPEFSRSRGTLKNQLDALAEYGVLVKERKDRKMIYSPTTEAYRLYR